MITLRDRYRGCLLGGTAGDALGAGIEFLSLAEVRRRLAGAASRARSLWRTAPAPSR